MGVFALQTECQHGHPLCRVVRPNYLMYEAVGPLLDRVLNATGGPFTCRMGFSGPMYQRDEDRVVVNVPAVDYSLSRRGKWTDFIGAWGMEGCAPEADEVREMSGYSKQEVSWQFEDDERGTWIDTGWMSWTNGLPYNRKGDWTPEDWDTNLGTFTQPHGYTDCPQFEASYSLPWCEPLIHDDWWIDKDPADYAGYTEGKTFPNNGNPTNTVCTACQTLGLRSLMSFQNGCAFVTLVDADGETPGLILAAAEFAGPIAWKPRGKLHLRYRGRFS